MSSHVVEQQSAASVKSSSLAQAFGAAIFGILVLFAVGFAPMDAAHNAAHDTRHSLAFPCH
ncbi:cobalt transporter subunit CbtB [Sinobacterium caligoides]|uniref:Cobalt transporter subunit CbtB n=1 Tax=Sinobacterium caligoides TaxID=933926 RepID=A0A3N2DYG3_9GAMM|nr:CbtB domain-containing protein [Sinobacterium caligoides]ROS04900.1 cobalt transporter subunit CbtB [Sinobacterium caligoides]